ncbi:MAG: DNA-binding protein WhiA [Clostridia bacterium]|nr:DNA-binding protein WhiA [Clostridia bacterium]
MTFSERVKSEILSKNNMQPCCQIASLSAFIRGAGTISVLHGKIGFEIITENQTAIDYYLKIIKTVYGLNAEKESVYHGKKYRLRLINDKSSAVLVDLGILSNNENGISINLNIDKYLLENDCCVQAYVLGAFIGSGSVTVPSNLKNSSTSYHLEFVFSKYQTASDFANVLSQKGFMPKYVNRKESHVVYFKNGDEISELLFYMGATKACFELKDIVISKDISNETNRRINCEMANIDKQGVASDNHIKGINLIKETIGLDGLSAQLKQTALLRLNYPESSLEELSKISGLTKSCINHRLRKILEIANNL